jgi:hypothetical protein
MILYGSTVEASGQAADTTRPKLSGMVVVTRWHRRGPAKSQKHLAVPLPQRSRIQLPRNQIQLGRLDVIAKGILQTEVEGL